MLHMDVLNAVIGDFDKKGRHMSFPRANCPRRTDESFRNKTDSDYHKEDMPLLKLSINLIEDVIVADSRHLIDLGWYGMIYMTYR